VLAFDSGQAPLRHTRGPAESCFLPDLTRFTGSHCAGPDPQRLVRVVPHGGPSLEREFSPPDVGLGYRAPRAPRLARSTGEATRRRVTSAALEGCESGRIGTLGKRVWGNSPWVRIPLPPPARCHNHKVCASHKAWNFSGPAFRCSHARRRPRLRRFRDLRSVEPLARQAGSVCRSNARSRPVSPIGTSRTVVPASPVRSLLGCADVFHHLVDEASHVPAGHSQRFGVASGACEHEAAFQGRHDRGR
jgi:hypothetical protein